MGFTGGRVAVARAVKGPPLVARRTRGSKFMKQRPTSGDEIERMRAKIESVACAHRGMPGKPDSAGGAAGIASRLHYLAGLWTSCLASGTVVGTLLALRRQVVPRPARQAANAADAGHNREPTPIVCTDAKIAELKKLLNVPSVEVVFEETANYPKADTRGFAS